MKDYTYIIARIRSMETKLLSNQDIEQLIAASDEKEASELVRDKRAAGEDEMWELLEDAADESVLALMRQTIDYHNIKAAVKTVYSKTYLKDLLLDHGSVDKQIIYDSVTSREYGELPRALAETAEAALTVLLRTQDGQLCDLNIDKAWLAAAEQTAERSGDSFIKKYVELMTDTVNLKTALRCAVAGRSDGFIENAVYDGGSLDRAALIKAAAAGKEELVLYISGTDYADADMTSVPAFERYCDDRLTSLAESAKYDITTAAPILAYAHAKQTEIAAIRLIVSAKRSRISNDIIRERVRRLYE